MHTPRFVDRDMVMRFHPGIAVGHSYSQGKPSGEPTSVAEQGVPMDVDIPTLVVGPQLESQVDATSYSEEGALDNGWTSDEDEEGWSGQSGRADSADEGSFYAAEPDSEEDPDFYA